MSPTSSRISSVPDVVQSGVEQRVAGSPEHVLVLRVRMLFAVAVGVLGLAGLLLRWRGTGRLSVPALALAAAPAFIVLAGSYGGEGFLRIYYFSLLGLVPMVAWLAFPDGRRVLVRVGEQSPVKNGTHAVV